jgi:hypothetical protein
MAYLIIYLMTPITLASLSVAFTSEWLALPIASLLRLTLISAVRATSSSSQVWLVRYGRRVLTATLRASESTIIISR